MKTKRINREKTELALREVLADVVVATVVELVEELVDDPVDDPVEELVEELVEGWGVQSCSVQPTLNGKNFE